MKKTIKKLIKKTMGGNNAFLIERKLKEWIFVIKEWIFVIKENLTGYSNEKRRFKEKTGYDLDLKNPQSFNQKLVWKKIYDRNPLLPITADKYRVREYIKKILGEEEAENILVPLLYVTNNPETIPFDDLPDKYIIKANHGSGTNIIVEDNSKVNREEIIEKCKDWLKKPYGFFKHEWAYQKIKRKIVIEELLQDKNDNIPEDYKFFIFHGKCQIVRVGNERLSKQGLAHSTFTPDWRSLYIKWGAYRFSKKEISPPENYEEMLALAETLGKDFDFVRVDLYSINNNVYFGELTHYPSSGTGKISPQSFDFELGKNWKLQKNYWKK